MLSWFRRLKYRNEVLAQVMAIQFNPDGNFTKYLQHYYPGTFDAIRNGFTQGQNTDELSVIISSTLLTKLIEGLEEDRRNTIFEELAAWGQTPGAIANFSMQTDLENASDALASRLKWGLWYVEQLHKQNQLDEYYVDLFCAEIYGALMGKSDEERAGERRSKIFSELFKQPTS